MKSLVRILLIIMLIQTLGWSQGNQRIDSLKNIIPNISDSLKVKAYTELFQEYMFTEIEECKWIADSIINASQRTKNADLIARGYNVKGIYFNINATYDSSLVYFTKAKEEYEAVDNEIRVSSILNNIGICQQRLGDFKSSLQSHLKSIDIQIKNQISGDPLASNYWNISNNYSAMEDYQKAIEWNLKAQEIYTELKDQTSLNRLNSNLASDYNSLERYDEAYKILLNLKDQYAENQQYNELASVYDELGYYHLSNNNLEQAESHLLKGLELALNNGEQDLPGNLYRRLTLLYMKKKEFSKAENFALKSLENASIFKRKKKKIHDLLLLSEIYENQGDYVQALDFHKQYQILKDSIFNEENQSFIEELETKYETEKKEQEIAILSEKHNRAKVERNGLIGGAIALVALFSTLFYAMRQRIKRGKTEREKLDQELAFNLKELASKKQELTAYALQIAHKNEVLENIKTNVKTIESQHPDRELQKIVNTIDLNQNDDDSWKGFRERFIAVHKDFEKNVQLKFPQVTSNDLRLMALIKMQLSTKEIANILNITPDGVKKARYRLRKKLSLESNDSLEELIHTL